MDSCVVLTNILRQYGQLDYRRETIEVINAFSDTPLSSKTRNSRQFLKLIEHFIFLEDKVNSIDWKEYKRLLNNNVD